MPRPNPLILFKQSLKSDAKYADELINIYLLRPIASLIVWFVYPTRITPNQVTMTAIILGMAAAYCYTVGSSGAIAIAGILIVLKDLFDDADGQLARAKNLYSRRGRFLDSIGDFVVDVAVFSAITMDIYRWYPTMWTLLAGFLSFWSTTLRVSYHVFYQVSYFHLEEQYMLNRISEEVTEKDREGDHIALGLQKIFILLYGWQDRLMVKIDAWCKDGRFDARLAPTWYADRFGLRLSGLLGFGTEFTLLASCSWMNDLPVYLFLNLFLMNGIWLVSILYRRIVLMRNLM
jgi:phosphatidylglycerophosphate synthase